MTKTSVAKASGIIDEITRLKTEIYLCKSILANDAPIYIKNEPVGYVSLNLELFGEVAKEEIINAAIRFLNAEKKDLDKQLVELPPDLPDDEA